MCSRKLVAREIRLKKLATLQGKLRLVPTIRVVAYLQAFHVELADAQALQAVEPLQVGVGRQKTRDHAKRNCGGQLSPKESIVAFFS